VKLGGGVSGAHPLKRRDLFPHPIVDGREVPDDAVHRLKRRLTSTLVSGAERDEADLERRLRTRTHVTRPNLVAVASPKGGVGKTVTAFLVGNLLASHLKVRAIALDGTPGFGTIGRFTDGPHPGEFSLTDVLDRADQIGTAADLGRYVSRLSSGLHLLAAPPDASRAHSLSPDRYGELVALLCTFYETVVLDLRSGVTGAHARLAIDRADHVLLVTTPEQLTATLAIHALEQLNAERTTVVVNRTHPRRAPELRAIEECLDRRGFDKPVTLPDDRRLATMLDTGTYSLEALDRRTRLPVKRLGLAVADRLV
jgi:MinD-like ATPase involved in chromosome partitioning or flagellar assembly